MMTVTLSNSVWRWGRMEFEEDNGFISERELTFTFALCCRQSVYRLSVTFVRPTQAVQIFGNISTALGTLAIH